MISVGVEFGVTLFVELVGKLRIIPSRKNEIFAPYRLALYRVEIGYDYIVYVIINIFFNDVVRAVEVTAVAVIRYLLI